MSSRFWVGGTGTWDSTTTTHWSASTGGAGGATAPVTGDSATFDGASGGGTVTVDTTINGLSLALLTTGAFTGTLDFSVNNPSMTFTSQFTGAGTGVRTINLGSGTFTCSGATGTVWDFSTSTNLTFNAGTSTILINGAPTQGAAARTVALGTTAKSFNIITITNSGSAGPYTDISASAAITIATLNLTAPVAIRWANTATVTITNAFTWAGTAFNNVVEMIAQPGVSPAISAASGSTIAWGALSGITFSGNAVNATNSFDMKGNTMNGGSITGPSGGGAGAAIGF